MAAEKNQAAEKALTVEDVFRKAELERRSGKGRPRQGLHGGGREGGRHNRSKAGCYSLIPEEEVWRCHL